MTTAAVATAEAVPVTAEKAVKTEREKRIVVGDKERN